MRTVLVALALVAAAGSRDAWSKRRPPDDMLERAEPIEPCGTGKTWKVVETCLAKQGTTKVVYEAEAVKIVQVAFGVPSTSSRFVLYTEREGKWFRGSLYASTSPNNDLLGVTMFPSPLGAGVRIDLGQTFRTTVSFNEGSTRGVVRRVTSTICVPNAWQCRAVMTSCETYMHGRLAWTFHGAVTWHPSLGLRLQGDTTQAGGMCMPPTTMLDREEQD